MTRLEDKCYEIYNRKGITGGATSVINYIMEHRPDVPWHYCVPCDATQPFDPDTESCLVCGSAKGFLQDGKTAPSLIEDARREHQKVEDRRRKRQLAVYEMERDKVRRIIESEYGREYSNQAEDAPGPCIVIKEEGLYLYFKRYKSYKHSLNLMVTGGPVPESRLNVDSYFTFVSSMASIGETVEKYLKQRRVADQPLRR